MFVHEITVDLQEWHKKRTGVFEEFGETYHIKANFDKRWNSHDCLVNEIFKHLAEKDPSILKYGSSFLVKRDGIKTLHFYSSPLQVRLAI